MYEPQLEAVPTTVEGWWAAVHHLVAAWYGVPPGPIGRSSPEVVALSEALGRPLPRSVHEWASLHTHLAEHRLFTRALRDHYELGWQPELRLVTLLLQGEGDHWWGISEEQLDDDDPPVDSWWLDQGSEPEVWRPGGRWAPNAAALAFLHVALYLRGVGGFGGLVDPGPELDALEAALSAACATRTVIGDHVLFEGTDLIGRVSAQPGGRSYYDVTIGERWRDGLPEALDGLARTAGSVSGVLIPPDRRPLFEVPGFHVTHDGRP